MYIETSNTTHHALLGSELSSAHRSERALRPNPALLEAVIPDADEVADWLKRGHRRIEVESVVRVPAKHDIGHNTLNESLPIDGLINLVYRAIVGSEGQVRAESEHIPYHFTIGDPAPTEHAVDLNLELEFEEYIPSFVR
jgi:hypothetical protein